MNHVEIVLVAECFPPAVGGSGELLAHAYAETATTIAVVTAAADPDPRWPRLQRTPATFPAGLGLLNPRDFRHTAALAGRIRHLSGQRTVVHCARALPEGTAAWMNKRLTQRPYVCWTHGEELPVASASRELAWLMRRVHRGAAALIANSHNTARLLAGLGNPPEKIHVVHPGVDVSKFRPDVPGADAVRRRLLGDEELLVVSIGRLQARKGHDLAARAIARAIRSGARIRYAIVGSGEEEARIRDLVDELGIAQHVRFVGAVATAELPAYYAAADVFALPNRVEGNDFEGFGIVYLEAGASGVPVIAGRSGGVPEAVQDGVTGLLVSGTDENELFVALKQLIDSRERRRTMGQAGRARAVSEFGWERAAARVVAIDDEVRRGH